MMILVVTEGARDEPALIKILVDHGFYGDKTKIVSYGTNIHCLIGQLREYDWNKSDELDISMVLREVDRMTNGGKGVDLLSGKFSDVLLIFDLDPQDGNFDLDDISWLVSCFSKDTTEGKLFLNYPMFDVLFYSKGRKVDLAELSKKGWFKEKAHQSIWWRKFSKARGSLQGSQSLAANFSRKDVHDLLKEHRTRFLDITGRDYCNATMVDLFERQKELIVNQKKVYCINTSVLSILDFSS